jgi:non-homologous end joining protein Ku
MAPRANWKGYLRLSLVSCPIALYPASSLSEKVSFNRINRLRRSRQLVSTGVLCRKASLSICLTRKSATSAREMNPHVQLRGSTNAR